MVCDGTCVNISETMSQIQGQLIVWKTWRSQGIKDRLGKVRDRLGKHGPGRLHWLNFSTLDWWHS